ncbi:Dse1p ASCRUDRAFT_69939 [Ascoidea rubescens DSM 1968]|uniref:Uncharacterized protein n=1 Tax=Ascoidea rubescens DSM 1968 TaxID=1344418 RepID=A0A1D2VIG7_9ASCO|nr:hypothetical protein ASCRUDRAFT_69939 [Ascoidea rubescens DSM 1968]ODV61438.1 hypothetical protein ASCRUDRAFT_69939 [Ascoidea rubescens DSM 1968]
MSVSDPSSQRLFSSSHWRVNDSPRTSKTLTCFDAIEKFSSNSASNANQLLNIAVSNNSKKSNLNIYQLNLDKNYLVLNQSITLDSNISSLKWLNIDNFTYNYNNQNYTSNDLYNKNLLLAGRSNGKINLLYIPDSSSLNKNAKVLRTFTHPFICQSNKSFKLNSKLNMNYMNSNLVNKISTVPDDWSITPTNKFISLISRNSIYLWDINRKLYPIYFNIIPNLLDFNESKNKNSTLALAGKFGISLLDLRVNNHTDDSTTKPTKNINNKPANLIKWSKIDSNILASAHNDGIIRVWDIRSNNYFAELIGNPNDHYITSLEFNNNDNNIYSTTLTNKLFYWDIKSTNLVQDKVNKLSLTSLSKDYLAADDQNSISFYQDLIINSTQSGNLISKNCKKILHIPNTNCTLSINDDTISSHCQNNMSIQFQQPQLNTSNVELSNPDNINLNNSSESDSDNNEASSLKHTNTHSRNSSLFSNKYNYSSSILSIDSDSNNNDNNQQPEKPRKPEKLDESDESDEFDKINDSYDAEDTIPFKPTSPLKITKFQLS